MVILGSLTSVDVGGTPGYEFVWSDQQAQESNGMLTTGIYTITVFDAHVCSKVESIEIADPERIMIGEIIGINHAEEFQKHTLYRAASDGSAYS